MKLVVTDANIVIDLEAGGLLDRMFQLPAWQFSVPDQLYIIELERDFARLPGLGLIVSQLDSDVIQRTEELRRLYRKPSLNDLFALALAYTTEQILLTGDSDLRDAAGNEGVEVHGTLWVVGQIADTLGVDADTIEDAYEAMKVDGSRLPWKRVKAQIEQLRKRRKVLPPE